MVTLYEQLLVRLAEAGVAWVQIDEPVLVTDILPNGPELAERVYGRLGTVADRPAILVATYFGDLGAALPALARTPSRRLPSTWSTGRYRL